MRMQSDFLKTKTKRYLRKSISLNKRKYNVDTLIVETFNKAIHRPPTK